jgi:hypothetical protein
VIAAEVTIDSPTEVQASNNGWPPPGVDDNDEAGEPPSDRPKETVEDAIARAIRRPNGVPCSWLTARALPSASARFFGSRVRARRRTTSGTADPVPLELEGDRDARPPAAIQRHNHAVDFEPPRR